MNGSRGVDTGRDITFAMNAGTASTTLIVDRVAFQDGFGIPALRPTT